MGALASFAALDFLNSSSMFGPCAQSAALAKLAAQGASSGQASFRPLPFERSQQTSRAPFCLARAAMVITQGGARRCTGSPGWTCGCTCQISPEFLLRKNHLCTADKDGACLSAQSQIRVGPVRPGDRHSFNAGRSPYAAPGAVCRETSRCPLSVYQRIAFGIYQYLVLFLIVP